MKTMDSYKAPLLLITAGWQSLLLIVRILWSVVSKEDRHQRGLLLLLTRKVYCWGMMWIGNFVTPNLLWDIRIWNEYLLDHSKWFLNYSTACNLSPPNSFSIHQGFVICTLLYRVQLRELYRDNDTILLFSSVPLNEEESGTGYLSVLAPLRLRPYFSPFSSQSLIGNVKCLHFNRCQKSTLTVEVPITLSSDEPRYVDIALSFQCCSCGCVYPVQIIQRQDRQRSAVRNLFGLHPTFYWKAKRETKYNLYMCTLNYRERQKAWDG